MNKIIDVVIIGQNEGPSVEKIIKCLPVEWNIFYVADRCTDNTLEQLKMYDNVYPIDTTLHGLEGRQTSYCRNLGLYFTDQEKDVLFLDGDRWISNGDIRSVVNQAETDITLLRIEKDNRDKDYVDDNYGLVFNGFFSCGIYFKRDAINKIINHKLLKRPLPEKKDFYITNKIPQLFPESLQHNWGIEDTSLGDICYDLGLTVTLNEDIRLHGEFSRLRIDSLDTIEDRFKFRNQLDNIRW